MAINFADNIPHDCDVLRCIGKTLTTGIDPGRDEIVGTADDLPILTAIDTMFKNKKTLFSVVADPPDPDYLDFWN